MKIVSSFFFTLCQGSAMKEWFDRDLCPGYDCQRGGTLGKALRMMGAHTKTQIITTFEGANCDQVKKEVNARI
jgi:hypothetical protein